MPRPKLSSDSPAEKPGNTVQKTVKSSQEVVFRMESNHREPRTGPGPSPWNQSYLECSSGLMEGSWAPSPKRSTKSPYRYHRRQRRSSILRALWCQFQNLWEPLGPISKGKNYKQGASTITMQVVRNLNQQKKTYNEKSERSYRPLPWMITWAKMASCKSI